MSKIGGREKEIFQNLKILITIDPYHKNYYRDIAEKTANSAKQPELIQLLSS